jgi:hypothetical protein
MRNMKSVAVFAVILALSGQAPAAPSPVLHLVYEFGYNTKVAKSGPGTGTTTIDVGGVAADGGLMVSGTDFWWNTVRPRATNTCEVYVSGSVSCLQRPYALSPIQLTIFPLLARHYFKGLSMNGTSNWKNSFEIKAAIVPGANGFAGQLYTWSCTYTLEGKGVSPESKPLILIQQNGTLNQQGGRFRAATEKAGVLYDPVNKVPAYVSESRTHLPQSTVYNKDSIEVKLIRMKRP